MCSAHGVEGAGHVELGSPPRGCLPVRSPVSMAAKATLRPWASREGRTLTSRSMGVFGKFSFSKGRWGEGEPHGSRPAASSRVYTLLCEGPGHPHDRAGPAPRRTGPLTRHAADRPTARPRPIGAWLQADATRRPLRAASIDGAWSPQALLYVTDLDATLGELARAPERHGTASLTVTFGEGAARHVLCGAHLLRELTAVTDHHQLRARPTPKTAGAGQCEPSRV